MYSNFIQITYLSYGPSTDLCQFEILRKWIDRSLKTLDPATTIDVHCIVRILWLWVCTSGADSYYSSYLVCDYLASFPSHAESTKYEQIRVASTCNGRCMRKSQMLGMLCCFVNGSKNPPTCNKTISFVLFFVKLCYLCWHYHLKRELEDWSSNTILNGKAFELSLQINEMYIRALQKRVL